jgi:hypothetical protein
MKSINFFGVLRIITCYMLLTQVTGCTVAEFLPYSRDPPFAIRDFLVDKASIPPGWDLRYIEPVPKHSSKDVGDENISMELAPTDPKSAGGLIHTIYRLRNPAYAKYMYKEMLDERIFFNEGDGGFTPKDWTYVSPFADDWRFACKNFTTHYWCGAMARYDEFISIFSTVVHPNVMTMSDLLAVLKSIDKQFAEKLGK